MSKSNSCEFCGRYSVDGYVYTKVLVPVRDDEWEYVVQVYDEHTGNDIDIFCGDKEIADLLEKQMECYPSGSVERNALIALLS